MIDLVGYFILYVMGIAVGYIWFAPDSPRKQGFIDGMTFRFIWGRFIKNKDETVSR